MFDKIMAACCIFILLIMTLILAAIVIYFFIEEYKDRQKDEEMGRIYKWVVDGENGGTFASLKKAKRVAVKVSLSSPNNKINIILLSHGKKIYRFEYVNGKCTHDGYTEKYIKTLDI